MDSLQLNVLRQLVELQLVHSADIKAKLDRAWGVAPHKQKKKESEPSRPKAEDPFSRTRLQLLPIGQDVDRKRYWIADGPCTLPSRLIHIFACICQSGILFFMYRFIFVHGVLCRLVS